MKKTLLPFLCFLIGSNLFSQKVLWTSEFGGQNSNGAICTYDFEDNSTLVSGIEGSPIADYNLTTNGLDYSSQDGLNAGSDNYIYGTSHFSGGVKPSTQGVIYKMHPDSLVQHVLHVFGTQNDPNTNNYSDNETLNNIYNPICGLKEFPDNSLIFYGFCTKGGANNKGGIFKFDTNTGDYQILDEFDCSDVGCSPVSNFAEGPNDELYFLIQMPSSNADVELAKIDKTNGQLVKVDDLLMEAGLDIYQPNGEIVYDSQLNAFFGVCRYSIGPNSGYGGGVFRYDFSDGKTHAINQITNSELSVGSQLRGMVRGNDGAFYIVSMAGGNNGKGSILKYATGQNMTKKADLNDDEAAGVGLKSIGDNIFGVYTSGTNYQMFQFDVATEQFNEICANNIIGDYIQQSFAAINGKIYGYANNYIGYSAGNYFSYEINGGATTQIGNNTANQGRYAIGSVIKTDDNTAYFFSSKGGEVTSTNYESGTILKYNLTDHTVTKIYDFNTKDYHIYKEGHHVIAANGKVYFTVKYHQPLNFNGLHLYELDPTNDQVTDLYNFYNGSSAYNTFKDFHSGLVEYENNKIAIASRDSLWLMDLSTQAISKFKYPTDSWIGGSITHENGKLYFQSVKDANNQGTDNAEILTFEIATSTFGSLYSFENEVNKVSNCTIYNGYFYGSTTSGGTNNDGYLFKIQLTDGQKTILKQFDRTTDGAFFGGWSLLNDSLISTSYKGGANNVGTLVSYDISEDNFSVIQDMTLNNGKSYRSSPAVYIPSPTGLNSSSSESNTSIYPNPAAKTITINTEYDILKVFTVNGEMVSQFEYSKNIDVNELAKGVYIVQVIKNKEIIGSEKLIISE